MCSTHPPSLRTLTPAHVRSVLCPEQRVWVPSCQAPFPWFLQVHSAAEPAGGVKASTWNPGPRVLCPTCLSGHLHCENSLGQVQTHVPVHLQWGDLGRVPLLSQLPNAHQQNELMMPTYFKRWLQGLNEIKHCAPCCCA